ncbi:hypothetical protein [Pontibacter pudoricolor]|uniref:hypothetical protein n=1 Tax=Pontibacter pudoricolor TaxID=2694930 RepID=UPI001391A06C|nr:hypothetical protein [Pontibacter pudoricolor]
MPRVAWRHRNKAKALNPKTAICSIAIVGKAIVASLYRGYSFVGTGKPVLFVGCNYSKLSFLPLVGMTIKETIEL